MRTVTILRFFVFSLTAILSACTTPSDAITQQATILDRVIPRYPALSINYGEEGNVLLLINIRVDGSVGKIKVKNSSGSSRLDDAAIDAVRRSTFVPAKTQSGRTVGSWMHVPYKFTLDD